MRQRFMFWLDHEKAQEKEIAKEIQFLKNGGLFSRTLRDGIRLILDLRQGKVDVLLELFPWVLEMFAERSEKPSSSIEQQLQRLEMLMLQQGHVPIQRVEVNPTPAAEETEINLEVKQAGRDENNNSTYNFLIAGALAVYGNYESLSSEVIEYGLRTGRIPADMAPQSKSTPPANKGSGNPRAMDVPQFDAPIFDDDFDLDIIDTG